MTTRFRERGGHIYGPVSWKVFDSSGIETSSWTGFSGNATFSNYESMADVVTPDFKKLQSEGKVVISPFSQNRWSISSTPVSWDTGPHPVEGSFRMRDNWVAYFSIMRTPPSWYSKRVTEAQSWTLVEAHANVAQPDFQGLVTVAEAGKTARMLASPFAAAEALLRRVLARRASLVQRGVSAIGASTSAWLEYRFGWRPILYDIEGIWKAYIDNTHHWEKPVRMVARANHMVRWEIDETYEPAWYAGTLMGVSGSHETRIRSGVLYELYDGSLEMATARRMGMRLSDVPASLWELVPFSFVVDRFVSVGSWLQAIVPKPGVRILGSWTSTASVIDEKHTLLRADHVSVAPVTTYRRSGGLWHYNHKQKNRVVNPPLSVPAVNPRDLNLNQTLDHLAILYSLFNGIGIPRR